MCHCGSFPKFNHKYFVEYDVMITKTCMALVVNLLRSNEKYFCISQYSLWSIKYITVGKA